MISSYAAPSYPTFSNCCNSRTNNLSLDVKIHYNNDKNNNYKWYKTKYILLNYLKSNYSIIHCYLFCLFVTPYTNIFSESDETSAIKNHGGDIFQKWISLVWCKHVSKLNEPTVLIVDNYSPHSSKDVIKMLKTKDSFLSIIPSGCSSNIHPLNRGIKRSFKVSIFKI